jgi:hypothetical protein
MRNGHVKKKGKKVERDEYRYSMPTLRNLVRQLNSRIEQAEQQLMGARREYDLEHLLSERDGLLEEIRGIEKGIELDLDYIRWLEDIIGREAER